MKRINLRKAQPIPGETVPDTKIFIDIPIEDVETLEEVAHIYEAEAELLFGALKYSLPGGTFDRLAAKMLAYEASLLIIPHEIWKED